jgi:putative aldouronate transport system substrate-binding protein
MKKLLKNTSIVAVLLTIIILASLIGCGGQQPAVTTATTGAAATTQAAATTTAEPAGAEDNFNPEGYPIVKEQIKLNVATRVGSTPTNKDDLEIIHNIEALTNIDMVFENIPDDGWNEKINLYFAAGTLPDVIINSLSINTMVQQGALGQIIPLNDLIDQYMPNMKEVLADNPSILKTMTAADGNIYSLFSYDGPPRRLCGGWKLMINHVWMEKLGLETPNTTDELVEVLKAFRDKDPNGNGKADEIPLLLKYSTDSDQIVRLAAPWGVATNYYIDQDTKVPTAGYAQDGYREALKFYNMLYKEKLIDQELFTMTRAQYQAKAGDPEVIYGMDIDHMPGTNMGANAPEYSYIPPISLPGGERQWYYQSMAGIGLGRWCISNSNPYPKESIRLGDYFYTLSGSMEVERGLEGTNWVYNSDGVPELQPNPEGWSYVQFKDTYRIEGFPACLYTKGREYIQDVTLTFEDNYSRDNYDIYGIHDFIPTMIYTEKDTARIAEIQATLHPYREEMLAKFVVGELDIDSNWESHLATMESMGLSELLTIYNNRYQLYLTN